MASESIITMTVATQAFDADLFPISQAGANLATTRTVFLSCLVGEQIAMQGPNSKVGIDAAENVVIIPKAGQTVTLDGRGLSIFVGYVPANPGDWAGSPADLATAIDRIARVVSALGVTPIP